MIEVYLVKEVYYIKTGKNISKNLSISIIKYSIKMKFYLLLFRMQW